MKKRFMFLFLLVFSSVLVGSKINKSDKWRHRLTCIAHPLTVGEWDPCPPKVGKELVKFYKKQVDINERLNRHQGRQRGINILEVGAGIGNITENIVEIIKDRPQDKLFVVECIEGNVKILKEKFKQYKNVFIQHQKAEDWNPEKDDKIDFIICTIPVQGPTCAESIVPIFNMFKDVAAENATLSFVTVAGWERKWWKKAIKKLYLCFAKKYRKALKHLEEFKTHHVFERVLVEEDNSSIYVYHARLNVV